MFDRRKFDLFCKKIGAAFPETFIDYLMVHNDADLEPNRLEIPANETSIRYFYGTGDEDYSDIEANYFIYKDRLPSKCIPIAPDPFGNQICMSLSAGTYGKIYFWDHETMDTYDDGQCTLGTEDMILIADSFEELCKKIKPANYDVLPDVSPMQVKWNRFVSWLRTKWNKL